jgi:hypothetical protein
MLEKLSILTKEVKNKILVALSFCKSKLPFTNKKEEVAVLPCVGDIVEWSDGSRSIVTYVDLKEETGLVLRHTIKKADHAVTNRGRINNIVVTSGDVTWPLKECKLIRDGYVIFPQKQWKLNFIVWLSSKLLK